MMEVWVLMISCTQQVPYCDLRNERPLYFLTEENCKKYERQEQVAERCRKEKLEDSNVPIADEGYNVQ